MEMLLARMIEETLAIDAERGAILVQGWYDWLAGCDRHSPSHFNNVEDFVNFRNLNSGFW